MTEEQIFQKVYNVYLNYEQELANRGMEDVQSIASHLTMAYMVQLVAERLDGTPVTKTDSFL
tara:strand:- start:4933 stop:5118 length:186 start_codon:yes stop_codon:yes gene_type:complete